MPGASPSTPQQAGDDRFRLLAESANAMICVIVDRQIVYANPYASELTGYTRDEILGRRFVDFVHPDYQAAIEESLAKHVAGGPWPGLFETALLCKDGSVRWVEVSSSAVMFEGTRMVTGIAIDITERKRIAAELDDRLRFEAMANELSKTLFDVAAPDVNAAVDAALQRIGRFLDVDRISLSERVAPSQPRKIFFSHTFRGRPVERERGLDELHPWAWAKVDAGECVAFGSLAELPPEAAVDRASWERRGTRSMMAVPISVAGEYRFALSVATVDRERHWPQPVLEQVRVLGEILANALVRERLDHELRSRAEMLRSLNTELSRTEDRARRRLAALLHDDLAQNLFGTSAELIAIRNTAPEALQMALDRVLTKLDESLRQARDLTYDLCPPVLYELGLVAALQKLAERFSRQHEIAFALAPNAAAVEIDSDLSAMLYQAVRELFLNIAKHAKATAAQVTVERADAGLTITITDNGIGCPDAESKVTASASGFGLFNIRERLQSLGGHLSIGNGPSGGCVVTLSVPISTGITQGR